MKKVLGYNSHLIRKNLRAVMIFEVLLKIAAASVLSPLIMLLIELSIKWAGIRYVTRGNLRLYLSAPTTVAVLAFLLLILLFYTLFEISSLIVCFDNSRKNIKITVIDITAAGFKRALRFLRPSGLPVLIMTVLVMPVSGLPLFSGVLTDISLNSLIKSILPQTMLFKLAFPVIMAVVVIISLLFILMLHYMVIEGKGYFPSLAASFKMLKGRKRRALLCIVMWYAVIAATLALIYGVLIGAIALIVKYYNSPDYAVAVFLSIFRIFNVVIVFAYSCLAEPLVVSIISALFFRLKQEKKEKTNRAAYFVFSEEKRRVLNRQVLPFVFLLTSVLNIIFLSSNIKSNVLSDIEMLRVTAVTAHRGSSKYAPENTLAAIQTAIDQTANYAEIDVHQTADGQIVLLHDSSLERTTGLDKSIWEVTYDEISGLDAGGWFSQEFQGEKIPTLEEAIELSDGNIMLNIEIKSSEYEKNIAAAVVEIIKEYDFIDSCIITSFDYSLLCEVKELEPDISTGLISSMVIGNYSLIPSADIMSLKYSTISKNKVEQLHDNGIKVLAWTVNNKTTMEKLVEYGVDNIITDNPMLAREVVYSKDSGRFVTKLIEIIFDGYA